MRLAGADRDKLGDWELPLAENCTGGFNDASPFELTREPQRGPVSGRTSQLLHKMATPEVPSARSPAIGAAP